MVDYTRAKALKELVLEKMNEVRFLQEAIKESDVRLAALPQDLITEGQRQDADFWKRHKRKAEENLPISYIQLHESLCLLYKEEPTLFLECK